MQDSGVWQHQVVIEQCLVQQLEARHEHKCEVRSQPLQRERSYGSLARATGPCDIRSRATVVEFIDEVTDHCLLVLPERERLSIRFRIAAGGQPRSKVVEDLWLEQYEVVESVRQCAIPVYAVADREPAIDVVTVVRSSQERTSG